MTENFGVLLLIAQAIGILATIYFNARKQPSEIKVVEADAAEIKAKTTGQEISNQQALFDIIAKQGLTQIASIADIGAARLEVTRLSAKVLELDLNLDTTTKRAVSAEKRADAAETSLITVGTRVDGYPALIEGLRAEIEALKKAAAESSSSRLADANTRENVSQMALEQSRISETKLEG